MKRLFLPMVWLSTLAHGAAPGELPEALRGVKAATGMCTRDDLRDSSHAGSSPAEPLRKMDASCGISVREMVALSARQELTLIDLRGHEAHAQTAIDGSLSMTVGELRTKSFLHGRPLVLIGDGRGQRELLASCTRLRAQGFAKPMVLWGGLPAWQAQGQPVVGRTRSSDDVPLLTAAELWAESQFDANLIVVAEPLRSLQQRLPGAVVVESLSSAAVQRALEQRRKLRAPAVATVVVASPATLPTDQLRALREAVLPLSMLAYAGSAATFAKDMQRQSALWAAHARGPKQPGCGL
jgi:rhodanese-related sulfurtransferase